MSRKLSRKEAIAYLANVLSVAQVHDDTSKGEAVVLKSITERIGADNYDLRGARALLSEPNFKLRLIMLPEMRMSNLEDMVMMALVDNKIDSQEAELIEKLAHALNYTQVDVNMLVRRAQGKLQKLITTSDRTAKETKKPKPPPLPTEKRPKPPKPPAAPPITNHQPSLVRRSSQSEGGTINHSSPPPPKPKPAPVTEPAPDKETLVEKTPPPKQKTVNPVDTCQQTRDASSNPREYCFGYESGEINVWGCRLIGMNWTPGAEWFQKGHFRDNSTFVFDKNELVNKVTKNFLKCKGCPHVNIDYIEMAFDLLPSRANIIGRWTHHKADHNSPHAQRLEVKRNIHGCETRQQMLTNGVDPIGTRGAMKIIKQATRKAQSDAPDYKLLEAQSSEKIAEILSK